MTDNLFDLTYWTARALGIVKEGYCTAAGSSDKKDLVDTNDRTEADDYWNGGTAWILYDAGGVSSAPEGEYAIISDFDNGTGVADFRAALTVRTSLGDKYAIGKKRYPLYTITQKINESLYEMGTIPITDYESLDTAASKTEYSIPIAANLDLREVWIETNIDDTNDYRWSKLNDWYIQRTSTGTADLLVFPQQPRTLRDLKLNYMGMHPELVAYTDKLSETVHPYRVVYEAAARCLLWRKQKVGMAEPTLDAQIAEFKNLAAGIEYDHPIRGPKARKKLFIIGATVEKDRFTTPSA